MKVLLSIKPDFANKIFDGTKKYEFRKIIFRNQNVSKVVVYASSPVCRVIGEFEIENILCDELTNLWDRTKADAGINKEFYFEYFSGHNKGYAIKVGKRTKYRTQKVLKEAFGIQPPQSFQYI